LIPAFEGSNPSSPAIFRIGARTFAIAEPSFDAVVPRSRNPRG